MKELGEYLIQKFHHILAFLIMGLCGSYALYWGIRQFFNQEEFGFFDWILVLIIALIFSFYMIKRDFGNFLFFKNEEKSPRYLYQKLNQSIIEKQEEVDFVRDRIKEFNGSLTNLKHEKVLLEERRAEFLKNHPELIT
jgi:hypothetical protein